MLGKLEVQKIINLKKFLFLSITVLFGSELNAQIKSNVLDEDDYSIPIKHNDYVPDSITAVKIAEAIWLPIYGKKIYNYIPFKAKLKGDTMWFVEGTIYTDKGGAPTIKLLKYDCKIIDVYHPK